MDGIPGVEVPDPVPSIRSNSRDLLCELLNYACEEGAESSVVG